MQRKTPLSLTYKNIQAHSFYFYFFENLQHYWLKHCYDIYILLCFALSPRCFGDNVEWWQVMPGPQCQENRGDGSYEKLLQCLTS